MEFNSSGLFTAISIDIFYSVDVRYIFNNFYNSIKLINFDDIDELLLEKF